MARMQFTYVSECEKASLSHSSVQNMHVELRFSRETPSLPKEHDIENGEQSDEHPYQGLKCCAEANGGETDNVN